MRTDAHEIEQFSNAENTSPCETNSNGNNGYANNSVAQRFVEQVGYAFLTMRSTMVE